MPNFMIMENLYGVREDVPFTKLSKAFMAEGSENVFLHNGLVKRMQGRAKVLVDADGDKVPTPDGNPIIHFHLHNDEVNGIEYLFCYTKAHVYLWVPSTYSFTTKFTCSGDCTLWDTGRLGGKLISTNGVDKVLVWDDTSPGSNFVALDDTTNGIEYDTGVYLTTAKYLIVYENYIILGHTTEDGTTYPYRWRWCSRADSSDWNQSGAGDAYYNDFLGSGTIKGFGIYTANNANLLIIFMKDGAVGSIHTAWLTTEDIVFQTDKLNETLGLLATHSVVNDKNGNLYFIGTDYAVHKLFKLKPISNPIDNTIKNINQDYEDYIESTFIDKYNHIWWTMPSSSSSTGNDLIIAYDLNYTDLEIDVWYKLPFNSGTRAFGSYSQQTTYTIDTLDTVYSTIDGIGYDTIDTVEIVRGFPLDLASDYSGETWRLHFSENDAQETYTFTLVLATDLATKQLPGIYKRINEGVTAIYDAEASDAFEVTHTYKRDDDSEWQTLDTANLQGTGEIVRKHLPLDIRSIGFKFRQQGTARMAFHGLWFNGFEYDGDR